MNNLTTIVGSVGWIYTVCIQEAFQGWRRTSFQMTLDTNVQKQRRVPVAFFLIKGDTNFNLSRLRGNVRDTHRFLGSIFQIIGQDEFESAFLN